MIIYHPLVEAKLGTDHRKRSTAVQGAKLGTLAPSRPSPTKKLRHLPEVRHLNLWELLEQSYLYVPNSAAHETFITRRRDERRFDGLLETSFVFTGRPRLFAGRALVSTRVSE